MRYWIDECIATGPPDIMPAQSWSGNFEYHANNLDDEEQIERSVMVRDNQTCRLIGATDDIAFAWIFPPPFRNQSWFDDLHKDNNIGVDVNDDYRIVVLRDMGPAFFFLPTHLPRHEQHDTIVDSFLRDHF
ncbi:hypothetical protein B0H13DRAFT_2319615 [Mycena leptocephala]|nr:hypothetical protein B0H13DRAFT_2319615 [Mycena leptocephala]